MKILMVCLGNICRSPLAEGIMRSKIEKQNLAWTVQSSGTSGFHNGESPHNGSITIARAHGIDISHQRSSMFKTSDLDLYDHILVMDASNYNDVIKMCMNENQRNKVELLMNFAYPSRNIAVPDPYYVGGFDKVYDMIEEACDAFIYQYA